LSAEILVVRPSTLANLKNGATFGATSLPAWTKATDSFKASSQQIARDRRRYLNWLFEAKKRFSLSVLNYMVTSNHVHLLVKVQGLAIVQSSRFNVQGDRAGRNRSPLGVRRLSRALKANSASERCIAQLSRKTDPMRCVIGVRLTTLISAAKVSR
jgi:hypothetical protein